MKREDIDQSNADVFQPIDHNKLWASLFSQHKITKNPLIQVFLFGMAKIHGAMGAWHLLAIKESAASMYEVFSYCSISRLNNFAFSSKRQDPGG